MSSSRKNDVRYEAARKAAARYPTDSIQAAVEYRRLLGGKDASHAIGKFQELIGEMISILEPYRHPFADVFGEYMSFIDPDCCQVNMSAYQNPPFLKQLEDLDINDALYDEIYSYVKDCERTKLKATACEEELDKHVNILKNAEEVYNDNLDKRSEVRNSLVTQSLGLSTGRVPRRINEKEIYIFYMKQVRHKGLSCTNAVENTQHRFDINSYDATLKILHKYRSNFYKRWEETHPSLLPKVKTRLKGFIPSRR